jgi:hypothetical protein
MKQYSTVALLFLLVYTVYFGQQISARPKTSFEIPAKQNFWHVSTVSVCNRRKTIKCRVIRRISWLISTDNLDIKGIWESIGENFSINATVSFVIASINIFNKNFLYCWRISSVFQMEFTDFWISLPVCINSDDKIWWFVLKCSVANTTSHGLVSGTNASAMCTSVSWHY